MRDTTKKTLIFGSYDFSNSGYVLMFQSFLFPIMLTGVFPSDQSQILWAVIVGTSSVFAIALSPFVGLAADQLGRSRIFRRLVLGTGVLAAASMLMLADAPGYLIAAFVIFNCAFELSQTLYDSFLKDLTSSLKETTRYSSAGWAIGYAGGILVAVMYFAMDKVGLSNSIMLLIFALVYTATSWPAMRYLGRQNQATEPRPVDKRLPRPPVGWTHLAIYWIIADCVAAILYFTGVYARTEIGLSTRTIGALMLGAQVVAIPSTIAIGALANRYGHILLLRVTLVFWVSALIGLGFARSLAGLIPSMILISIVIGSTQALLRAHFAMQVSSERPAEGFGFYAVAQKSAAVLSPLIVGIAVAVFGSTRPAFFILSGLVGIAYVSSYWLPPLADET